MKYALVITGVPAGLAMMAPMLVVLGYLALIIPGLILTAAPTVFVYLAATATIRRFLPISSPKTATAVALCAALLLGWAVMQPYRASAIAAYEATLSPDVIPQEALALHGHVRLERPDHRRDAECDYLCLALLDAPDVRSVTIATAGRGYKADRKTLAAYALESTQASDPVGRFPHEPGQVVREHPALAEMRSGRPFREATKAVEAEWAVRLSGNERLRVSKPVTAEAADWVISLDNQTKGRNSKVRRVTVRDAAGTVHFRKSYVKQAVPAKMFYYGFDVSMGAGTISSASFHVGRQILSTGELSLRLEPELLTAVKLPLPDCDPKAIARLRVRAEQALNAPNATPAQLELARRYLGLFFFDATDEDHALIAQIVADGRVRDIDDQLTNVFSKNKTPLAMRDAFAERIVMDLTSEKLRLWLAERLAELPTGAFAKPAPAHLAIWNTPTLQQQAGPFIARVADLGADRALPILNASLDTVLELEHWNERHQLVDGIREGFVRLGPNAIAAAPRLKRLFLLRPSPLMTSSGGADDWRFALAWMGVAIEDLPFFPTQSPEMIERICRRVVDKLKRYEQDHAKGQTT